MKKPIHYRLYRSCRRIKHRFAVFVGYAIGRHMEKRFSSYFDAYERPSMDLVCSDLKAETQPTLRNEKLVFIMKTIWDILIVAAAVGLAFYTSSPLWLLLLFIIRDNRRKS